MTALPRRRWGPFPLLCVAALLAPACAVPPLQEPPLDRTAHGARLYRRGTRPDGSALTAIVAGDVRVEGTQFSCASCHQASGMGSSEGWLVAPPITARALTAPRLGGAHPRPAYTRETLLRALTEGVDPTGRPLAAPMPRYELDRQDADALVDYLLALSAEVSAGVTPTELHVATVVAGDVDASPMLEVLEPFFEEKNRNTRNETARATHGAYHRANVNRSYRKWILHLWRLNGAPGTWRAQLEELYAARPVFLLVSGMTAGDWAPVQDFCDDLALPCLLPNVDLPPAAPSRYTLYASQGLRLEAARIALDLVTRNAGTVVQVYRSGSVGETAADLLREELRMRGGPVPLDVPFRDPTDLRRQAGKIAAAKERVLWVDAADLERLPPSLADRMPPPLLSSTLLDALLRPLPEPWVDRARLAHPFRLPHEAQRLAKRTEIWLRRRGISLDSDPHAARIQLQTHFACMLLGEALMHVKFEDFFRDYVLESIDHMTSLARFSSVHAELSFGPGQRTLVKGCYLLEPGELQAPASVVEARWSVPSGGLTRP